MIRAIRNQADNEPNNPIAPRLTDEEQEVDAEEWGNSAGDETTAEPEEDLQQDDTEAEVQPRQIIRRPRINHAERANPEHTRITRSRTLEQQQNESVTEVSGITPEIIYQLQTTIIGLAAKVSHLEAFDGRIQKGDSRVYATSAKVTPKNFCLFGREEASRWHA